MTQGLELNVTHRFNKGFALSAAYSGNRMRYLEFLNEYDRVITSATAASPRFIQFVTRFTF